MPELPEVETMVRGIRPYLTGKQICSVNLCPNRCRPISIQPGIVQIKKRLVGRRFAGARRLGKRIVLDVSDGSNLVIEPRMTGLVLLADPPDVEHLRLKIQVEEGGTYDSVWFWDRRGLGTVRLFDPGQLAEQLGTVLGTDALEMTVSHWVESCSKSSRAIKVLLLDQKSVAGIGNLYASEILHLAAINPMVAANSLKTKEIHRLAEATSHVLKKAVEYEGSTLSDATYRNALNEHGRYQNEHRVYMREGQECFACRKNVILRIVQAQRSTFYCPWCQRHPRKSPRVPN